MVDCVASVGPVKATVGIVTGVAASTLVELPVPVRVTVAEIEAVNCTAWAVESVTVYVATPAPLVVAVSVVIAPTFSVTVALGVGVRVTVAPDKGFEWASSAVTVIVVVPLGGFHRRRGRHDGRLIRVWATGDKIDLDVLKRDPRGRIKRCVIDHFAWVSLTLNAISPPTVGPDVTGGEDPAR